MEVKGISVLSTLNLYSTNCHTRPCPFPQVCQEEIQGRWMEKETDSGTPGAHQEMHRL